MALQAKGLVCFKICSAWKNMINALEVHRPVSVQPGNQRELFRKHWEGARGKPPPHTHTSSGKCQHLSQSLTVGLLEQSNGGDTICIFLLEDNCFTMLPSFLLYNSESLCVYMCPRPLGPPSPPGYPIPLGRHRALSWAPCDGQQLPTSLLFHV